MNNTERAAYVRGLLDGLELEADKKEVKVINALAELVEDLAFSLQELEDAYNELSDQVDEIDQDLASLEDDFYDVDSECSGDCESCDQELSDEFYYEITCPSCNETICLTDEMISEGEIDCPNCGEKLEFSIEETSEDSDEEE